MNTKKYKKQNYNNDIPLHAIIHNQTYDIISNRCTSMAIICLMVWWNKTHMIIMIDLAKDPEKVKYIFRLLQNRHPGYGESITFLNNIFSIIYGNVELALWM